MLPRNRRSAERQRGEKRPLEEKLGEAFSCCVGVVPGEMSVRGICPLLF